DLAVERHLRERPRPDEQSLRPAAAPATRSRPPAEAVAVDVAGPGRDARDARPEVVVDGGAAVALDGGDERGPGDRAGEGHGEDRGDRDPRAEAGREAHGRSPQPTPRTVCRIRGSPADSSLRRT